MTGISRPRPKFMLDENGNIFVVVGVGRRSEGNEPRFIVQSTPSPVGPDAEPAKLRSLTERERQIAYFLAKRSTNREIARELGISTHTARHHSQSVLDKLGLRSRAQVRTALLNQSGTAKKLGLNRKDR